MFTVALLDSARVYRRQWWRLALVQLIALVGMSAIVLVAALVAQNVSGDLLAWLLTDADAIEGRAAGLGGITVAAVAVLTLPVQLAAVVASVRVADRSLAGARPRFGRVAAEAFSRVAPVLVSLLIAVALTVVAFAASPFIVFGGVLGLVATGILAVIRRRRPDAAARWPRWQFFAFAAIPFAVFWRVASTAVVMPVAVVLEPTGALASLRVADRAAAGRRWRILGAVLVAVVVAVAVSVGGAYFGSLLWGDPGAVLLGGVVQLVALPAPLVVATALYRRAADLDGRTLASSVRERSSRPARVASPIMARVGAITVAALVVSIGIASGPLPAANAAPAAITAAGSSLGVVVTSATDSVDPSVLGAQAASCLNAGGDCTLRAALSVAQQAAMDGATSATVGFAGDLTIALTAPLAFAPDAIPGVVAPPQGSGEGEGGGEIQPPTVTEPTPSSVVAGLLTIEGGGHSVALDGGSTTQILDVRSEYWNLAVTGVEFRNGASGSFGGAIFASVPRTTITQSYFTGNTATSGAGAVFARALSVKASTFIGNSATYWGENTKGGAIYTIGATTVENATFGENRVGENAPRLNRNGDDIFGSGGFDVVNSTFVNFRGNALAAQDSPATVRNSIFTTNQAGSFACVGPITGSNNLHAERDTTCPGTPSAPRNYTLVGAVSDAGVVPVYPLTVVGNPAVGAGVDCPTVDALGTARSTAVCDLGAVEFDGKTSVALSAYPDPNQFGAVTFSAAVTTATGAIATGTVVFTVGGVDSQPVTLLNGVAQLPQTGLPRGPVTYSAAFTPAGPPLAASSAGPTTYTVEPLAVSIALDCTNRTAPECAATPATVGDSGSIDFTASVGDVTAGSIVIATDAAGTAVVAGPKPVAGGSVTFGVAGADLGLGTHDLYAIYTSDDQERAGTSAAKQLRVLGTATATLTRAASTGVYGDPAAGTATVVVTGAGPVPTGSVTLRGIVAQLDATGTATIDISQVDVVSGAADLTAQYSGDSAYAAAASNVVVYTTTRAATSTTITSVTPSSPGFGQDVTVGVTVRSTAPSTVDAQGAVTLLVDGTAVFGPTGWDPAKSDRDGVQHFDVVIPAGRLAAGAHDLVASFDGAGNFADSASATPGRVLAVAAAATVTTVTAQPATSTFGDALTLTATVDASASDLVPAGTVRFTSGSAVLGTATLTPCAAPNTTGCAVATVAVSTEAVGVGSPTVGADYAGSTDFAVSAATPVSVVVAKAAPTARLSGASSVIWGEQPNFSIRVGTATTTPADGTVVAVSAIRKDGAGSQVALGTARLVDGAAIFAVPTRLLESSTYTVTASFAGDGQFAAASASAELLVRSVATTMSIAQLADNRPVYGTSIDVTVTVTSLTGTLAPEGDVVLSWLGRDVGRATLGASDDTASPRVRTVTIPASFAVQGLVPGDGRLAARFIPSSGFAEAQTGSGGVEAGPLLTVVAAKAKLAVTMSATLTQPLTAVATVSVAGNPAGVIPSGRVVFNVTGGGTSTDLTAPLVGGRAELPPGLVVGAAGPWVVRATYVNDGTDTRYTVDTGDDFARATVDVDTASTVVTATAPALVERGKPIVVDVTVAGAVAPTGFVRLTGGTLNTDGVKVVDGRATITAEESRTLVYGDYTMRVEYYGDATLRPASSADFTVSVIKAQTTIVLGTSNDGIERQPGVVGASVTYTAKVTTATGPADGVVVFTRDSTPIGQTGLLDSDGAGSLTVTADVAWRGDIVATFYPFDGATAPSTQRMTHSWVVAPVIVTLTGATNPAIGRAAAFTARVDYDLSGFRSLPASSLPAGAPAGMVRISDGRGAECSVWAASTVSGSTTATGSCELVFSSPGDRTITASFVGGLQYLGAGSTNAYVSVGKGTPALQLATPGGTAWLGLTTVPVAWDVRGPSTGTVTIKLGSVTVCSSSAMSGRCDVAVPRFGDADGDTVSLEYGGNAGWAAATTTVGGKIVACIPFRQPSATKATFSVFPAPNCDDGTGYYTTSTLYVSAGAAEGYSVTTITDGNAPYPAEQQWFARESQGAGLEMSPVLTVLGGKALPFTFGVVTDARCVPVVVKTTGITDKLTTLNAVRLGSAPRCGAEVLNPDNSITSYFKVDTTVTISHEDTAAALRSTFYGWDDTTATDRFARSFNFTVAPESNRIKAAYGPLCYTGVPSLTQPTAGTLTTTQPAMNCAEPQSGKKGWIYGTRGTGDLTDTRVLGVTRTYFADWAGDRDRYSQKGEKTTYAASAWTTVRSFDYPITDKPFTIGAKYDSCFALKTEVAGDDTNGAPGTVSVSTPGNCPIAKGSGSGAKAEVWYTPGTMATVTTEPTAKKATRGSLYFLGWSGLPEKIAQTRQTSTTFAMTADTTAVASYGTDANCRRLNVSVVPAGALDLTTTYSLGTNPCLPRGSDEYDQGVAGNGISFDAKPATRDAEGAEIVFAWATAEPGSGAGTEPTLGSVWNRTPSLGELFYGKTDVVAYACEFVELGARVKGPEGQTVAGASNTSDDPSKLDDFIRTSDADCSTGADPKSGWGPYAWTVGTQLLPIAVADPAAYRFTGWSDDAKGVGETPDAPVNLVGAGRTATGSNFHYKVTANFTAICHTLSLPYDADKIEVITAPNCPGVDAKERRYLGGTAVVLHGPDSGDTLFRGWTSGTDEVDKADARWASVVMSSDKTVIANYTSKSLGERMASAGTAVGDVLAVASKKMVGIVAAAATAYVQVLLAKVSLVAEGIGYLAVGLENLGVHGAGIDGMKNTAKLMTSMLSMLSAPFDCVSAWAAGGSNTAIYAAQNLIGSVIVVGLSASAAKPPAPAAKGASSFDALAAQAMKLKSQVAPVASGALAINKAKNAYAVANGIGLEMTAHDAWGSQQSASVFGSCMAGKATTMATDLDNLASGRSN